MPLSPLCLLETEHLHRVLAMVCICTFRFVLKSVRKAFLFYQAKHVPIWNWFKNTNRKGYL